MGDAATSQRSLTMLLQTSISALSRGHLPPKDIIAALISKALGLAIIAGGSVVKLPQISALLSSSSAAGLAISAFELENVGFIIFAAYGYLMQLPLTAYGEAVVMLLQNTLLLALIYRYTNTGWLRAAGVLGGSVAAIASVLTGHISIERIKQLFDLNSAVMAAARMPQIVKNFKTKDTGQLSIVTYAANTLGCIARIFTSYQDGGGIAMIRSFLIALVLNATIAIQIMLYRPKEGAKTGKKQR